MAPTPKDKDSMKDEYDSFQEGAPVTNFDDSKMEGLANPELLSVTANRYQRRVKVPIFKGTSEEDVDTHLAHFEEMLRANHEQNNTARLELFPSSLDKEAFVWYTQFPENHFKNWTDLTEEFLDHYCKAKEESDLYSILQNMTQKKGESVQNYISHLRVAMRRLTVKPSDRQMIRWMRKVVKRSLVVVVEQNLVLMSINDD